MHETKTSGFNQLSPDQRPDIVARSYRAPSDALSERHWVRQDPFATAFFNALSAVFPHGETFMIRSLLPWVDRVEDPLRGEVEAFIEQEAGHSREHVAMNKALIGAGYDIAPLDRKIRGFVSFFEDANDHVKLTATMCIEHFTAIIAAELLKFPGLDAEGDRRGGTGPAGNIGSLVQGLLPAQQIPERIAVAMRP